MIKIAHVKTANTLTNLPIEVINEVNTTVQILDEEYGETRDMQTDLGGYVVIIDDKQDFEKLKKESFLDIENDVIPEFVSLIECKDGQVYTSSLILLSSDYSITVIMKYNITPATLLAYLD